MATPKRPKKSMSRMEIISHLEKNFGVTSEVLLDPALMPRRLADAIAFLKESDHSEDILSIIQQWASQSPGFPPWEKYLLSSNRMQDFIHVVNLNTSLKGPSSDPEAIEKFRATLKDRNLATLGCSSSVKRRTVRNENDSEQVESLKKRQPSSNYQPPSVSPAVEEHLEQAQSNHAAHATTPPKPMGNSSNQNFAKTPADTARPSAEYLFDEIDSVFTPERWEELKKDPKIIKLMLQIEKKKARLARLHRKREENQAERDELRLKKARAEQELPELQAEIARDGQESLEIVGQRDEQASSPEQPDSSPEKVDTEPLPTLERRNVLMPTFGELRQINLAAGYFITLLCSSGWHMAIRHDAPSLNPLEDLVDLFGCLQWFYSLLGELGFEEWKNLPILVSIICHYSILDGWYHYFGRYTLDYLSRLDNCMAWTGGSVVFLVSLVLFLSCYRQV
ncbi:MAG: hypothetical protein Q9201_001637 [Fulgogasparrea decipioides]